MKIKTALILCAGYGIRLNPISLKTPKPLIEINNITLLDNTLNIIEYLGIKNIKINTFYLQDQIINFISNHRLKSYIEIIQDGDEILDTGGVIDVTEENRKREREDNTVVLDGSGSSKRQKP